MKGAWRLLDPDVAMDLWSRCAPGRYAISASRLKSHCFEAPLVDEDSSHWRTFNGKLTGFICVKRSANPSLYAGPDPTQAHVNLLGFQDFAAAKELLDEACAVLRAKGVTKLVFGADSRHFFPGCPKDWEFLESFLRENGFEGDAESFDVERNMADYVPPTGCLDPLVAPYEARPCKGEDLPALTSFFDSTFPHRWKHDCLMKWNLEGPETIFGLFEGSVCLGFALLQKSGCTLPIGGAVWEQDLGADWGSLGPIGISESVRGKGLGNALLGAALAELKARGAIRSIIDWTTLSEFYGAHGFQVSRRYVGLARAL